MKNSHVSDVAEPILQWGFVIFDLDCRSHAPTIVMTAHNDVFDAQHIDGVLQGTHQIEINVYDEVGHIPYDKDRSCVFAHDFVGWDPGVGAAYVVRLRQWIR